jgi:hypothetical protein
VSAAAVDLGAPAAGLTTPAALDPRTRQLLGGPILPTLLRLTGSLHWTFLALAFGLLAYGGALASAVASGAWFRREPGLDTRTA